MEMMRAENYSFTYRGKGDCTLTGISFQVKRGEVILIAGDSGSGKSTFLKSLNGLIPEIVEGQVGGKRSLRGKDMATLPIYAVSEEIGSVFQNPRSQFFTLNSTSELVFAMENYGLAREEMERRLEELNRELPLRELLDRELSSLSSGEKQLLALGCASALRPGILLFDEPSANLDRRNAMRLKSLICRLKEQGKTILIAEHRYFYLNHCIDRVFLLRNRTLEVFESEEAFKASGYDMRGFDLFGMELPFRTKGRPGETVASLCGVSKWGILRDVSLVLREREITALIGVNGAGKTTLARLLTGALKPDKGRVDASEIPFYVMQDADYQLFGASVLGELEIGRKKRLSEQDKKRVLEPLGLWGCRHVHPFDLSGGEKQRLQIAVASLADARLLIFDEPTSGLDARSMECVSGCLGRLAETKAILLISHDYEFIRRTADRIVYLKEGRIMQEFALEESTLPKLDWIFVTMEENDGS